ncbi:Zn-ribbon domain-containing OB-fold protein [Streptomyces sp. NPDC058045]|uniref:Zn-ribbon domain-containing OB-fold protein n=1 Tax=Streptomyces sp. NPDC058045 TaxID=3346311 RepID=UPI0036EBA720
MFQADTVHPATPVPTGPDAESATGGGLPGPQPPEDARSGELYFQRCRWCRSAVFRRLLCPVCAASDLAWERSAGTGVVRHVSVVGRSTGRPRAIAIVDMDEGFWLSARIATTQPDAVGVGTAVALPADSPADPRQPVFRICPPPHDSW